MTKQHLFSALILAALFLAGCTSAATSTPLQVPSATAEPTATPLQQPTVEETAVPGTAAQPVATSRGPDLHASDPATVSLASGGLQLVEFFRFT